MASRHALLTVFAALDAAGCPAPKALATEAGTERVLDAWEAMTGDIADADMVAGAVAYCRAADTRFWPTVGQVLGLIPGRAEQDDADVAWGDLLQLVRRHGWPNPPGEGRWALDRDPARAEAMGRGLASVGGWKALCALEDEAVAPARASFRAAYRATRQRTAAAIESKAVRELMAARGIDTRQLCVDPFADKPPVPIPQPVTGRRDEEDE